jgi:hypothetical protein
LETNIFYVADLLPAAHSSYYWQPWVRENAKYYEEKTRTKQGTGRQKRASENEQARAQQRGAAAGFHPAPFGYVDLGCYPPVIN